MAKFVVKTKNNNAIMGMWSFWLLVAAVFIIVELFSQSVWSLCVAIGGLSAMVMALVGGDIMWQGIVLVGGCILASIFLLPWLKRKYNSMADAKPTGMDALLGRKGIVTESILPGQLGRIRIDGDNWQVCAPRHDDEIPAGSSVIVDSYDSIILSVHPE